MQRISFTYKTTVTVAGLLIFSLLLEYTGWAIFQKVDSDISFPGFLSSEVLISASFNSLGALLFGGIVFVVSCIRKSVRDQRKHYMFPLMWIGMGLFYLYMFILVGIGYFAI